MGYARKNKKILSPLGFRPPSRRTQVHPASGSSYSTNSDFRKKLLEELRDRSLPRRSVNSVEARQGEGADAESP
jgi:hypothetical protein